MPTHTLCGRAARVSHSDGGGNRGPAATPFVATDAEQRARRSCGEVSVRTCKAAARLQLAPTGRGGDRGYPGGGGEASIRGEWRGACAYHWAGRARRHAVRDG